MNKEAQRIAIANYVSPTGHILDYLNDLNAMHEAVAMLSGDDWESYEDALYQIVPSDEHGFTHRNVLEATAEQRAEAFLKAIGKWQVPEGEKK